MIHLDFEIFSELSLKEAGAPNYFAHPSTEPMCMAWSVDRGPVRLWLPEDPPPAGLQRAVDVHAHNASFEHYCLRCFGFPPVPVERMQCSAARARHANLPGKLATLTTVLDVAPKDTEGHKVMLQLCKPGRKGRDRDPHKLVSMWHYCKQDVRSEIAAEDKLPPLPAFEKDVWLFDRRRNERGIPIDMDLCQGASRILREAQDEASEKLAKLTGGRITKGTQRDRILQLANTWGVNIGDLQAETVSAALGGELSDDCRALLEMRQYSASAAVSKYAAATARVSPDGRLRENSIYYGAAQTGRWAGSGFNHYNLKKGIKQDEELIEVLSSGDLGLLKAGWDDSPITLLGKSVRGLICAPPGKRLVDADSGQIELRLAHWYAGDQKMLDACRLGFDPYRAMAAKNLGKRVEEVTQAERDFFKILSLGCQFGMGSARFAMLTGFSARKAHDIITKYREDNPEIASLWRRLDNAAMTAIRRGRPTRCGKVRFALDGDWLTLRLPSGRNLYYYKPEIQVGQRGSPGITFMSNKGYRTKIWGGHWLEGCCQAACRDLLVHWMFELERRGIPVILDVYDQIVAEVDSSAAEDARREFAEVMSSAPEWAADLPLATEVKSLTRWEK